MAAAAPARPYFVTPHAVHRWCQRVAPADTPAEAAHHIQQALAHTRPEWRCPGTEGTVIVAAPWRGRAVLLVVDEHPPGGTCPAVVTVGGASHRRRWARWADARARGLVRPAHRRWLPGERDALIDWVTCVPLPEIARRLGRTPKAVTRYCEREGIYPTRQDLLASGDAARAYGVRAQWLTAQARAGRFPGAQRVPGGRWWLFPQPEPGTPARACATNRPHIQAVHSASGAPGGVCAPAS